jgi:hypothetical protein
MQLDADTYRRKRDRNSAARTNCARQFLQTRPVTGGKEIYCRGKGDLQRVHMAPVQHAPAPLALGDHQQVRARVDCHKFSKVSALVHLLYIKSI